jgi:ribose transport system substrate-binding protein
MSGLMAASLALVSAGMTLAQDESSETECAPASVTGVMPDLTEQLGRKPKVGLVMKSLANEFFQQMQAGAEAFAAENTDLFDFKAVGMQNETDFAAQQEAVENFITEQYDVIVIAPADSAAMVNPIVDALNAGVHVINIDVALDQQAMADAGIDLAFFGPDNRAGAKLAGDSLGQALGEGGKVVILEGIPVADNAKQRKLGFDDSVAEYKLDLLESRTANWETEEANSVMTDMLTKYPDVQGVMAANDSMALGVIAALEAAGKTGQVQVVGFDNIPGVRQYIKDGAMLSTVEQFGADMAVFGIEFGLRELAGETFCGWVQTPVELVTAENVVVP